MASREAVDEPRFEGGNEGQVDRSPRAEPLDQASPDAGSGNRPGGTAGLIGGSDDSGAVRAKAYAAGPTAADSDTTPLLPPEETERFRGEWESIQIRFVDEPRQSVQQADELVADLMRELAERFARQRSSLEAEWDQGEEVSTEDLRISLQRYRSFFERLLAA